jgi:hypothetical protein
MTPPPAPKNPFPGADIFYSENLFKYLNIAKQIKK